MAARAQSVVNCKEQTRPDNVDYSARNGSTDFKSGTSDERCIEEVSGNGINNNVKSTNINSIGNQNREMIMESYQDRTGTEMSTGRPRPGSGNGNHEQLSFPANLERHRMNFECHGLNQNSRNTIAASVQESTNSVSLVGYSASGVYTTERGSYLQEQHGGSGMSANINASDVMSGNTQQSKVYSQYNPIQGRFPQLQRVNMGPPQRPGNASMMVSYGSNSSPQVQQQQQRFLSGQSISQQGGPTPTLNQLLQAPNTFQRYQNNFGDYNSVSTMTKGLPVDVNSSNSPQFVGNNRSNVIPQAEGWGSVRSPNSYHAQMSNTILRNQGPPLSEPSAKRLFLAPGQQGISASPSPGQFGQSYSPQLFSPSQSQGSTARNTNPNFSQQVVSQLSIQQNSQARGFEHQPSSQQGSYQHQDAATVLDELQPDPNERKSGSTTPVLRTPSTPPSSQSQGVSPLRPAPSPSGSSTGSRSLSPAVGIQPNLPMPPRPASGQSDSGTSNHMNPSPMATQGFSQQMAPPLMFGNKMTPEGMGTASQMGTYSQQPGHYSQGTYHRPPGSMGIQQYGSHIQANYSGPGGPTSFPGSGGMIRMVNHAGSQGYKSPSGSSFMNSHYRNNASPPATYMMNNAMPPPNQYTKVSMTTGGAHAAAQAALMAAANSTGPRPSPTLRQHLQHKIYGNSGFSNMLTLPQNQTGVPIPPSNSPVGSQSVTHSMGPPQVPILCTSTPPSTGNIPASQEHSAVVAPSASPHSQLPPLNRSSPLSSRVPTPSSGNDLSNAASSVATGFTQTSAPSVAQTTMVTQSISTPVSSIMTAGTAVISAEVQLQQQPVSIQVHHHQYHHQLVQQNKMAMAANPPLVMDEGSQLSNASGSSSLPEERSETPKPNSKQTLSHPPTPNTIPSPGTASMSSFHDEFEVATSPTWPRTPASPMVNNQTYDHPIVKRPDGLLKLYELSADPDRKPFLDRLVLFSQDRGTPLTQCPAICKQPLDLYLLYLSVKERGGFEEVTKSKNWKDVAGSIGIGASSSAAYTLRKQYIKHLLPYECKFDRGGVDPQPIIQQVEATSKKKSKNVSNNSNANTQEHFPHPAPNSQTMDGYHPGGYSGSYHPGASPHMRVGGMPNSDYPASIQGQHPHYPQPTPQHSHIPNHVGSMGPEGAMPNAQYSPHPTAESYSYMQASVNNIGPPYSSTQSAMSGGTYGFSGAPQPHSEQFNPQVTMMTSDGNYINKNDSYSLPPGGFPPSRTATQIPLQPYSPYQAPYDRERFDQQQQTPVTGPPSQICPSQNDTSLFPAQQRYPSQQVMAASRETLSTQPSYQNRISSAPGVHHGQFTTVSVPQSSGQNQYPQGQQEGYRAPEVHSNYQPGTYNHGVVAQSKVVLPNNSHRDMFQPDRYKQPPEFCRPQMMSQEKYSLAGGCGHQQTQGDHNQYFRSAQGLGPNHQGWPQENQYHQYSSSSHHYSQSQREVWQGGSNSWGMSRFSHQGELFPSQSVIMANKTPHNPDRMFSSTNKIQPPAGMIHGSLYTQPRKEIIFPLDTVEGVTPVFTKRKKLTFKDVSPVEAWHLMMSLKSGLLAESTWSLDVLSVLLYDDNSVLYFGLSHLPGLLEVLLEHYRRCLNLVFGLTDDLEIGFEDWSQKTEELLGSEANQVEKLWFKLQKDVFDKSSDLDTSSLNSIDENDKTVIFKTINYTKRTKWGKTVGVKHSESLFLIDPDKKWDVHEKFDSGLEHWQLEGGDSSQHIQTNFENIETFVKYARILEESKPNENEFKDQDEVVDDLVDYKMKPVINSEDKSKADEKRFKDREDCCKSPMMEKEVLEVREELEKSTSNENVETVDISAETQVERGTSNKDSFLRIRTPPSARKRPKESDLEEETCTRDVPSLCVVSDGQDNLARRCLCLSTLIYNLSFVPGNDTEMSKHPGLLLVLGRLLLLHHVHSPRKPPQRYYDREEDIDNMIKDDSCSSLNGDQEWWWDTLHILRENTLITLANIAGQLDLAFFPEEVSLPLLNGLLHWAVCPSSYAQDPLPSQPSHSVLSPQRLALETMCKLSINDNNVDLLLATPPWSRIEKLFSYLVRSMNRREDQILREFSVVLLSNFAQADTSIARAIANQEMCVSHLITFVEQAEQSALQVANIQGINALRKNPELMGTTLDMVRRAASTLRCLSQVPENQPFFLKHQPRLLSLVMSQILDQGVASIVADILYQCSSVDYKPCSETSAHTEELLAT
ncbi:trithorax group protein osa-like isoform X1 [Tachypleus tridentatus]|uniref:trithorax group protein osa-like isoform X1 n=2 Tax=Tachypleus tridentatus TaxID=6853 RepID=UPI003FD12247